MWLKLIANKYVVGAAGLLLALSTVWAYGYYQYKQGAGDERAKIKHQQIAIALGQQEEKDRADAIYRGRILATKMAQKDLAAKLANSDRMLQSVRKQLQAAGTCSGLNDASGDDWLAILGESWAEYADMAGEAAKLSDQVTGLQGYVRALKPK